MSILIPFPDTETIQIARDSFEYIGNRMKATVPYRADVHVVTASTWG